MVCYGAIGPIIGGRGTRWRNIPEIHNLKDRKSKYAQQQTCKYIQTKLILERNHVYLKTFKQTVCWVAGKEN